jgi:hypothetical protein
LAIRYWLLAAEKDCAGQKAGAYLHVKLHNLRSSIAVYPPLTNGE